MGNYIVKEGDIEHFARRLQELEYAQGSIEKYVRDVRAFKVWSEDEEKGKDLSVRWKSHLRSKGYQAVTMNAMISSLNRFFKFMGWDELKIKHLKIQRKLFRDRDQELTKAEYIQLIEAARSEGKQRLALLMETVCATGIRVSKVDWRYDSETKTLTFSGTGATASYKKANAEDAPWGTYIKDIQTLVVENGVTGLGDRVVYGAENLVSVSLPDSLESIGEGAFRACTGLKSITVPDSVTDLSRVAFLGCSGLKEAVLGGTYTSLTDQLFSGCSSLSKVTIPATVTELELTSKGACSVFAGCAITEVTYGGTEEAWAKLVAADKNGTLANAAVTCLGIVPDPPEVPETPYSGKTGEVDWRYDPETKTLTLSGTGKTADYAADAKNAPWKPHLQAIETLVVEAGVTELGEYLVSGSDSLVDIQLPNTLTKIGYSAFRECNSLTTATVPDSVTNLVRCAFYFNPALETVVLGGTYTTLTDKQFQKCGALREVTLPGTVELIEANAFGSCNSLSEIHYGNTIAKWQEVLAKGEGATALYKDTITVHCTDGDYVYGRVALGDLYYVIEDGALIIDGEGAIPDFAGSAEAPWAADAENITKVVLKRGVTKIGANAFGGLSNLEQAYYVGTQTEWAALQAAAGTGNEPVFAVPFASGVEGSCGARTSWTFDPETGLLTISGRGAMTDYTTRKETPWYYSLNDIRQLVIEEGVTKAGDYAFHNCKNLARVTLPGTLELLGTYCMGGCASLTEIRVPEGVRVIGAKAFSAANGLTTISLPESLEYIDMKAFDSDVKIANVTYHGTAKQWEKVIVSCNANGNDNLLTPKGSFVCLKEIPDAADVYSDVTGGLWYKNAVQYLLENEFLPAEPVFRGEEPADTGMVLEALYRKAGTPGMYSGAGPWARAYSISDTSDGTLTAGALAKILYRAAAYNRGETVAESEALEQDALAWAAGQGIIVDTGDPSRTITRAQAASVLEKYLKAEAGTANRYESLLGRMKEAMAQGGDGRMYILAVDLAAGKRLGIKPGDCTLILFPDGKTMMVDSGVAAAESSVMKVLRDLGITSLDYLVLSHPHSDHVGNALAAVKYIYEECNGTVGDYYSSAFHYGTAESGLLSYLEGTGTVMHTDTRTGDRLTVGDVAIDFYNPSGAFVESAINGGNTADETVNNVSLLMKFTYGSSTYLTGGDLYRSQELQLLSAFGSQLKADVVKTNHHGCYTSNSPEWVHAVSPLIMLTHSDDIGDANIAQRVTREGTAFFSAGLDGNILVSMDNQANYVVYHQYDNVLRKDYHGSVNIGLDAQDPPDSGDDGYDDSGDDSDDDSGSSSGGSGSQGTTKPGNTGKPGDTNKPPQGTGNEPAWSNPFDDVDKTEWYYDAVKFASENNLMSGVGQGEFAPEEELSRAMLAQILFSREGQPSTAPNETLTDVEKDAWYSRAVAWALESKLVSGYGDGLFGPDDSITREQLVMILWRYAGSPEASGQEITFRDAGELSGYAQEAARWAIQNGILSGNGDGTFAPKDHATRAQVAVMLMRYFQQKEG